MKRILLKASRVPACFKNKIFLAIPLLLKASAKYLASLVPLSHPPPIMRHKHSKLQLWESSAQPRQKIIISPVIRFRKIRQWKLSPAATSGNLKFLSLTFGRGENCNVHLCFITNSNLHLHGPIGWGFFFSSLVRKNMGLWEQNLYINVDCISHLLHNIDLFINVNYLIPF